jgi:hypothetical protein
VKVCTGLEWLNKHDFVFHRKQVNLLTELFALCIGDLNPYSDSVLFKLKESPE